MATRCFGRADPAGDFSLKNLRNPVDIDSTRGLRGALRKSRSHLLGFGIFSGLLNLLFIVPLLYMLQVYDRVIPTRGGGTSSPNLFSDPKAFYNSFRSPAPRRNRISEHH